MIVSTAEPMSPMSGLFIKGFNCKGVVDPFMRLSEQAGDVMSTALMGLGGEGSGVQSR
jgi:hypothetical protein